MESIKFNNLNGTILNPSIKTQTPVKQDEGGFESFLTDSLEKVNDLQVNADEAAGKLASGEQKDIHTTMITLQKAEVSFEMLMQVRNKIVSAYDEIRRMPL